MNVILIPSWLLVTYAVSPIDAAKEKKSQLEQRACNVLHRICQQIDFYVDEHPKK
jgi:hypothetical protein